MKADNPDKVEIRGMEPDELKSVHRMLERAFLHTPKRFFDRQVQADPFLRPEDTRILLEKGIIRSSVRVYFRHVHYGGSTLKMGGIGDVGTDPSVRGRGYASLLMNDAVEYMKSKGTILSFLFTRINPFYTQFGYFTLPTLDLTLHPPSPSTALPYRKADLNRDLSALIRMYDRSNRSRTAPVVRDEKYWKSQAGFPRLNPDLFWVVDENEEAVCYARGFIEKDILKLLDFGYALGKENRLHDLIAAMAEAAQKKTVRLSYISQQEVDLFTHWPSEVSENTALMVRLLQLDSLSSFRTIFQPRNILFWEADRF